MCLDTITGQSYIKEEDAKIGWQVFYEDIVTKKLTSLHIIDEPPTIGTVMKAEEITLGVFGSKEEYTSGFHIIKKKKAAKELMEAFNCELSNSETLTYKNLLLKTVVKKVIYWGNITSGKQAGSITSMDIDVAQYRIILDEEIT